MTVLVRKQGTTRPFSKARYQTRLFADVSAAKGFMEFNYTRRSL